MKSAGDDSFSLTLALLVEAIHNQQIISLPLQIHNIISSRSSICVLIITTLRICNNIFLGLYVSLKNLLFQADIIWHSKYNMILSV